MRHGGWLGAVVLLTALTACGSDAPPVDEIPVAAPANPPKLEGIELAMETDGFEEVSLLGTSRIPYPKSSSVVVAASGQTAAVRLVLSDDRWDEYQMHREGAAIVLDRFIAHHAFFGVAEEHTYTCTGDTVVLPARTAPGTTSSGRCEGDGLVAEMTVRVVGRERTRAGRRDVDTVHVRVEERLAGTMNGTRNSDTWWDVAGGLPLRRSVVTDFTTTTGFGATHYYEQLSLVAKE